MRGLNIFNRKHCVGGYGGEELVIILPCTSLDESEPLSKKILQSITDLNIDYNYSPFNHALYEAKKKGRNRV